MAYHFVDARADAFRVSFIIQAGRNRIVVLAVLHTDIVNLLCVHPYVDSFSNGIQTARIYHSALADAFNLLRRLDKVACRNQFALLFESHYLQIHIGRLLPWKTVPPFLFQLHNTYIFVLQNYDN